MLAQPTPRPLEPPHSHTHTPCVSAHPHAHTGSRPRGHTHARFPPLPGPLHTNMACTHTHTHTRQEPRRRRDPEGGHLGLQLRPPPHPATSQPWAATPRTELCNWVENCKKNRKLETNPNPRTEGQPQIHSTSSRHPPTASCPAAPIRVGARPCASSWRGPLPCARGGV